MKPLYQEVADDIMSQIASGEYAEGTKLMTEKELSDKYKVSRVTVRKAMELLVADRRIYRVSGKGTFVGSAGTAPGTASKNLIGVILCGFSASYGMDLLKSLEKNLSENGYSMIYADSGYSRDAETKAILSLVANGAKGIIIQPVHYEEFNSQLMKLSLTGYPFVLIDRNLPGLSLPFVGTDNDKTVSNAMKFIFDKGHTDVCLFTPVSEMTSIIEERISAFNQAYLTHKGNIKGRYIFSNIHSPLANNPDEALIKNDIKMIEEFLLKNRNITCAFASEYSVARMIRAAAHKHNISIPEDLSLLTFDNHNDVYRKNSTTFIRQDEFGIAKKAIGLMAALLEDKEVKGKFYIESTIIDNNSVRELNK